MRDAGNLLTRAGLAIPSVDTDEITVHYRNMDELVNHLRWAYPKFALYKVLVIMTRHQRHQASHLFRARVLKNPEQRTRKPVTCTSSPLKNSCEFIWHDPMLVMFYT